MKYIPYIIVSFCFPFFQCSQNKQEYEQEKTKLESIYDTTSIYQDKSSYPYRTLDSSLVGIWQIYDARIAAGWNDTYQFFADSSFRFNYNQMDCAKRTLGYSGTWSLQSNFLTLNIIKKYILRGGYYEEAYGSCGSDSELVGAIKDSILFSPPTIMLKSFYGLKIDSSYGMLTFKFLLDYIYYYKITNSPNEYE
jgi:hypothetical protein